MTDAVTALAPARRRVAEHRVDHQPAFLLHAYPWRETSLIADVLARDHGRVALVAKGAKRPTSHLRGVLCPFCPLLIAWTGRGEVKTLVRAEWCGGLAPLRGDGLLAGFYVNELLVRLLPRGDAHASLFAAYGRTIAGLCGGAQPLSASLRAFEVELLRELGWLPALDYCVDGAPVDAGARYRFDAQHGLVRVDRFEEGTGLHGATALAMARGDFTDPRAAQESKTALRHLIRYHLDGRPLNTRRILRDLKEL